MQIGLDEQFIREINTLKVNNYQFLNEALTHSSANQKYNYEKLYNNLGNLLSHIGKYDEATSKYHKAIELKSDYTKAYSNLLLNLNYKSNFDIKIYQYRRLRGRLYYKNILICM